MNSHRNSAETDGSLHPRGAICRNVFTPRIGLLLLAALLLLSAPLALRSYRLRGIPVIDEPFDLNAFGIVTVKSKENACEYYSAAAGVLRRIGSKGAEKLDESLVGTWSEVDPDLRQWLDDNQRALELFQQGADQNESVYIQPQDYILTTLLPVTMEMRALAQLARLEGSRLESRENWSGAWKQYRAVLRSGALVGRHGCLIERMAGGAMQKRGVDAAVGWAEHPQVDAALLRKALDDIVAVRRISTPISANLRAEYFLLYNANEQLSSQAGWREIERGLGTSLALPVGSVSEFGKMMPHVAFVFGEPEMSRRVGRLMWANWLSQVDRPRFQRTRQGAEGLFALNPAEPKTPNLYSDTDLAPWLRRTLVARWLVSPASDRFISAVDSEVTRQGLLELTIALHLYAREHSGEYPQALEALRPNYLATLPVDPFGKGELLRYRREWGPKPGFTIWSVGADEIDDDGKIEFGTPVRDKGDVLIRFPRPKPVVAPIQVEPKAK